MRRWSPVSSASRRASAGGGPPPVSGAAGGAALDIDLETRRMSVNGRTFKEGDWISIDGGTGDVYAGQLKTILPDVTDPYLIHLLGWADDFRRLEVWAHADYPRDAERARRFGAQGIGLCRTEHMFFEQTRLPF